ncbi:MAG: ABC transporter permease [Actinoallomurus sp.]
MNPTAAFVLRRLATTVPVLWVMTILVFLIVHLVPGDPVRTVLGLHATPQNVAATRASMGLDRPLLTQYWSWLTGLVHGDLGNDMISHTPVTTLIRTHLPVTIELTLAAMVIGAVAGVGSGLLAGANGGWARKVIGALSLTGLSIPYFWLGIMLALVFADLLNVLPPSGYAPLGEHPLDNLRYLVLPVLTLALIEAAYLSRVTRGIVTRAMDGPSVAYLRAKGLSMVSILFKHVLRQTSAPIVTLIGIEVGVLLGGAVLLENIFGLPGLGSLVVTAVRQRDYTVVQGCVLVVSVMFVLATLLADLVVGLLDPRISHGR